MYFHKVVVVWEFFPAGNTALGQRKEGVKMGLPGGCGWTWV